MTSTSTMLRLVGLAAFASMASMRVCDPMLVALSREFHVTTGDASAVIAAFAVAYGVLQLIYGPLGDQLGKIRVIVGATSACALFSAATALAPSFTALVALRAAMGAAAAGIIPLSMAWIGDQVAYEQRQETLGRFMVSAVTGMMAGQWFGGFATETLGWRAAFAALSMLFLLAAGMLLRHAGGHEAHRALAAAPGSAPAFSWAEYLSGTAELLRMPRVRWVLAMVAIEGALAMGTLAFVPARMVSGFGLSASAAGGVMVLYGIGGLLYSVFARRWLAWLGEQGLALAGALLIASGLLLLAWAGLVPLAMLGCFLTGVGFYMLHGTLQVQATQMAPQARGTAVTFFACLMFLGQSTGVLLVAFSVDRGWLPVVFSVAAAGVMLLGFLVSRRVQPRGVLATGN